MSSRSLYNLSPIRQKPKGRGAMSARDLREVVDADVAAFLERGGDIEEAGNSPGRVEPRVLAAYHEDTGLEVDNG